MAFLLRGLIVLMVLGILLTISTAMGYSPFALSHIQIAIPSFIYVIFAQAFVMFYFIGTSKLADNIYHVLHGYKGEVAPKEGQDLRELFDEIPEDLTPYKEKSIHFSRQATLSKRKTIPWTMMMLVLGMIAFLLGGAHDTGMVRKIIHVGVVYGFVAAMTIGFFKQWKYLGKTHQLLRQIKKQFELPDGSM